MKLAPKYVTDSEGKRTEVILSLESYEALMEDLTDLAAIADRRSEDSIPHADFIKELKADGILRD